jgi:protein-arginine deiminase
MPEVTLDLARPFYLIKIFDKDSNDLKFVWSPNVFLDSERPDDSSKIAPETFIEDIEIKSNFEPPINLGEIKINHSVGYTPNITIKDILKIYFGYYTQNNSNEAVFSLVYTGQVNRIKASLNHTIIKGISEINKITDNNRNLVFSRTMTITDILRKLAIDDGGLEAASGGISDTSVSKQKGYAISRNISVFKHLKKLADMVDFDIYMDVFDKFNARLWQPEDAPSSTSSSGQTEAVNWLSSRNDSESESSGQLTHTVYFGVNTMDMELNIKNRTETNVEIISLADSEGDEVFTIEPPVGTSNSASGESTSGSSGEGTEKQVLPRFTKDDSDKIAEVIVRRNTPGLSGKITVIGSPQIRLGDGLKVIGQIYGKSPFGTLNSSTSPYDASFSGSEETEEDSSSSAGENEETLFKITGIRHLFNEKLGFITKLNIKQCEPSESEPEEGGEEVEEEEPEEGEEAPEEGEEEVEEAPADEEEEVEVPEEEEEEETKKAQILEVEDALFHHDSAVLLPSQPVGPSSEDGEEPSPETQQITGIEVISAIFDFVSDNPEKKLIIAGHTDTTGMPKYNFELSNYRGLSVLYLLNGNKPLWVNNSDNKHKVEDYQQILKHYANHWGWDCDPGAVDNIQGPKTREATRNFQERYNTEFRQNISVDGIVGKQTWGAFYDCYERELGEMQGTETESLAEKRGKIKFVSEEYKNLACGESHPIEEKDQDNYRSQINRRVEVIFFDTGEEPEINCPPPKGPYRDVECDLNFCPIYKKGKYEFEYIKPGEKPKPVEVIDLRIYIDADRTGTIERSEAEWTNREVEPGAIILNNCDAETEGQDHADNKDNIINTDNDLEDISEFVVPKITELPAGQEISLELSSEHAERVRIFNLEDTSKESILGVTPGGPVESYILTDIKTKDYTLGIEAVDAVREPDSDKIKIHLVRKKGTAEKDRVSGLFTIAPYIMQSNVEDVEIVYVVKSGAGRPSSNHAFIDELKDIVEGKAGKSLYVIPKAGGDLNDRWMQDIVEIGYAQKPNKIMSQFMNSSRDRDGTELLVASVEELLSPNLGHVDIPINTGVNKENSLDSFGNLDVTPPLNHISHPWGRIYYGKCEYSALSGHTNISEDVKKILERGIQLPLEIHSDWLSVGHVDEFLCFLPANKNGRDSDHPFKLFIASPKLAIDMLETLNIPSHRDNYICEGKGSDQIEVGDFLASPDKTKNIKIQQTINKVKDLVKSEFGLEYKPLDLNFDDNDIADTDIVDIPGIFHSDISGGKIINAIAWTAGMVNALVVKPYVIYPIPYGPKGGAGNTGDDIFEQDYVRKLGLLGLNPERIDDWESYHKKAGEVHCGTNAKRDASHLKPWWESS